MDGGEVLVARPLVEKLLEFQVADFPRALGWPDTSLLKGLRDALGHRLVDATGAEGGGLARGGGGEGGVLVRRDASDDVDDAGESALLKLGSLVILAEASDAIAAAGIKAAVQLG